MPGLAALQEGPPGGLMFLVKFEPPALARAIPSFHRILQQRRALADDGIEPDIFLGFLSRQSDQNPVTVRVHDVAVIIIDHDDS
jgi:hypothetical protein